MEMLMYLLRKNQEDWFDKTTVMALSRDVSNPTSNPFTELNREGMICSFNIKYILIIVIYKAVFQLLCYTAVPVTLSYESYS